MKWITRKNIRVNRAATCWLIQRFIDPDAEFIFVSPEEVTSVQNESGGVGFDAQDATYPHQNPQGLCSFAALVHERLADDRVLVEIARIVQAADIQGHVNDHPAAFGLQLISHGFPVATRDDHETVARAAFLYDALYASIHDTQAR